MDAETINLLVAYAQAIGALASAVIAFAAAVVTLWYTIETRAARYSNEESFHVNLLAYLIVRVVAREEHCDSSRWAIACDELLSEGGSNAYSLRLEVAGDKMPNHIFCAWYRRSRVTEGDEDPPKEKIKEGFYVSRFMVEAVEKEKAVFVDLSNQPRDPETLNRLLEEQIYEDDRWNWKLRSAILNMPREAENLNKDLLIAFYFDHVGALYGTPCWMHEVAGRFFYEKTDLLVPPGLEKLSEPFISTGLTTKGIKPSERIAVAYQSATRFMVRSPGTTIMAILLVAICVLYAASARLHPREMFRGPWSPTYSSELKVSLLPKHGLGKDFSHPVGTAMLRYLVANNGSVDILISKGHEVLLRAAKPEHEQVSPFHLTSDLHLQAHQSAELDLESGQICQDTEEECDQRLLAGADSLMIRDERSKVSLVLPLPPATRAKTRSQPAGTQKKQKGRKRKQAPRPLRSQLSSGSSWVAASAPRK